MVKAVTVPNQKLHLFFYFFLSHRDFVGLALRSSCHLAPRYHTSCKTRAHCKQTDLWTKSTAADMQHCITRCSNLWKREEKRKKERKSLFPHPEWDVCLYTRAGSCVITPIPVIKTSLCICRRTAVFLFFTSAQSLQSISTLQTNQFPYISVYSHLILLQCWWELEHGSLYAGI